MKRGIALIGSAVGLFFLYFFGLTRTGLIGPDEARYAAIGRAMAATGDWITPRLWGRPWFEKPALLYWMTAAGFKLGLGPELAPRLPVALASVAFLIYFFVVLRREFGDCAAWCASVILATSAGWLVYSHVAITDLPMSAAFAAAMLTILTSDPRSSLAAGILLGVAILAKGLVPLVLFIPALWFLRHRIRDLAILFGGALAIAAPWYILTALRNGTPFLEDFFWKHHFGRFLNSELQHGQPVWFYLPVLLVGIFPWIPLLALLFNRQLYREWRAQFLLTWFAWGFVFFSASRNKLPGYLLPLLPPLAVLIGIAAADVRARSPKLMALLAASAALLCLVPALSNALPQALAAGFSRTPIHLATPWILPALLVAILCVALEKTDHRDCAVAAVAVLTVVSVVTIVWRTYPKLDQQLSGRASNTESITCMPPVNRSQRYSIEYYAGRSVPDCK